MAGKREHLTPRERRKLARAVSRAEDEIGLELCVYLGKALGDEREHAEQAFVRAGLHDRPAVLVLVGADQRRVDIVTAPSVRERLSDDACARAISDMTPMFAEGKFVNGLIAGIARLVQEAGPGKAPPGSAELPDVVDG